MVDTIIRRKAWISKLNREDLDKTIQDILFLFKENHNQQLYNEALHLSQRYVTIVEQQRMGIIDEYFSATEKIG